MRNIMKEMGAEIRRRRKILKVLQPELAAISGVSTRTIQLVEQGKGNPSVETLLNIADPLGLTVKLTLKELEFERVSRINLEGGTA